MILGEPLTVVRVMHVAGRKRKAVVRGEGGSGNTQLSTGGKKKSCMILCLASGNTQNEA